MDHDAVLMIPEQCQSSCDDSIDLSVVILGYRAESALEPFVNELVGFMASNGINNYHLVLVGNYWPGMNDRTPQVVNKLAAENQKITPVVLPKEGKMGWDMRKGIEMARGKVIAVIDGDGQMPAIDVIRVYQKIKEGNFDLVKTYREERLDDWWRRFISYFYNLVFKILFPGLRACDINAKPKIFTKEFFDKIELASDDWFADAEIMIQARRYGARIAEIPTVFRKNEKRPSFVKFAAIFEFIKNLLKARLYESINYGRCWKNRSEVN